MSSENVILKNIVLFYILQSIILCERSAGLAGKTKFVGNFRVK